MRKYICILIILLFPYYVFSRVSLSISYEKQSKNTYNFKFTFTSDEIIDQDIWKKVNERLLFQLQNNKSFFIQSKPMPDYINEIISLITNIEDKEKAKNIYINNNLSYRNSGYGLNTHYNDDGNLFTQVIQSYEVTLEFIPNASGLVFEPLEFNIDNHIVKSKLIKL